VIAPLEQRVGAARKRLKVTREEAAAFIGRMDHDRRKWTQFLYGVDWGDPALYDLLINLEHIGIERACGLVVSTIGQAGFEFSPERQAAMNDLALASRVCATLAQDPYTLNLEVEAESRGGRVSIRGESVKDEFEAIRRVVLGVPGVTGVTAD
jgi:Cytidylate kinase-like family